MMADGLHMKPWMNLLALGAFGVCSQAGVGEWTSAGVHGGNIQHVEYVSEGVALALTNAGVYRTTNHGASWQRVQETRGTAVPGISVNRSNPQQVLLSADFLFRSDSGGAGFTSISLGNVSSSAAPKNAGFSRDGAFAWVIEGTGSVWRSADAGASWTRLGATLPAGHYWWIEPDATDR